MPYSLFKRRRWWSSVKPKLIQRLESAGLAHDAWLLRLTNYYFGKHSQLLKVLALNLLKIS